MIAFLAGGAAGFVHVVAGPDHLAAIAPLAADANRTAWRSGFNWGLGHTAGVLTVGALLLAFRELLPVEAISAWSERLVGVALIAVGAWGVW
jgi:hydrogenase/urease accessory protein HupE